MVCGWLLEVRIASFLNFVSFSQDGMCHYNASRATVKLSSYVNVKSGDAEALKMALVNVGPIAVGIDAHLKTFSFYAYGVYYDKQCGKSQGGISTHYSTVQSLRHFTAPSHVTDERMRCGTCLLFYTTWPHGTIHGFIVDATRP